MIMAELNINDMKTGIEIIADERMRQIEEEGYTSENDDVQTDGGLPSAAAVYALIPNDRDHYLEEEECTMGEMIWPWAHHSYKPSKGDVYSLKHHTSEEFEERIHELAKAGSLIAAEIDRLQRLNKQSCGE